MTMRILFLIFFVQDKVGRHSHCAEAESTTERSECSQSGPGQESGQGRGDHRCETELLDVYSSASFTLCVPLCVPLLVALRRVCLQIAVLLRVRVCLQITVLLRVCLRITVLQCCLELEFVFRLQCCLEFVFCLQITVLLSIRVCLQITVLLRVCLLSSDYGAA